MKEYTISTIAQITGGKVVYGAPSQKVSSFSTDSRTISPGNFFIPIKGVHFDGHAYIKEAVKRGAVGYVFQDQMHDQTVSDPSVAVIKVDNTLVAYGAMAHYHRMHCDALKTIAVTGSNGKTTTKDMIATLLSARYSVHATSGNFNNLIGVPRTLLDIGEDVPYAVLELGMNAPGEIKALSEMVFPEIAVITNIGWAHIGELGNVDRIADAKAEIVNGLQLDGVLVINRDDDYYEYISSRVEQKIVTVGVNNDADFCASDIQCRGDMISCMVHIKKKKQSHRIELPIVGIHNIYNFLFAVAVSYICGLDFDDISSELEHIVLPKMRTQMYTSDGVLIINDAYNANPSSLKAALRMIDTITVPGKKVVVLGDMLELGDYSHQAHVEAGRDVAGSSAEVLITVGSLAQLSVDPLSRLKSCVCHSNTEVTRTLSTMLCAGDLLLIKGSRGNKLEEIVTSLHK
ncbi:MAG: UDP-N-acetylmuramoyl-tripeptide--D-alanyl-D-alanine ligase [Candidatus Ancaeobacter aquaticus]|nr:UDP-N-acetylmuramoyl-tripeptide--D-alanyl-D-alanine ligase [Candidatus Ancaeobacter aquaticus]